MASIINSTNKTAVNTLSSKHKLVQKFYGKYARAGGDGKDIFQIRAQNLGYDELFLRDQCGIISHEHDSEQAYADLFRVSCGSGCPLRLRPSNATSDDPNAIVTSGTILLDLGSGAGHDVVLASRLVGTHGRVIGVDISTDMIRLATTNVARYAGDVDSCGGVSFVCTAFDDGDGAWTAIQEATGCVDVDTVISNGVINLCENKKAAFNLAYRCLKGGGHFLLSDVCKIEPTTTEKEEVAISCKI